MGPPITAEKCWQALAEVLSCEGETKRSGNTVNIRLLVLMREQEGVFFVRYARQAAALHEWTFPGNGQ